MIRVISIRRLLFPRIKSFVNIEYIYTTMKRTLSIDVFPDNALIDEKLKLMVKGLEQNQKITVKASVCENKQTFSSYGCFTADSSGVVDVTKHESSGGTYTGVDGMGLFWSMQQDPGQQKGLRLAKKDVTTPITVHMSVHKNHSSWEQLFEEELESIASTKVNRWYKAMDVKREKVKVGNVRGALFTPPGPGPFPGVIDVFGSAGGLIEFRASLLASRGFCVLALAFFMYEDLPEKLEGITLDYFKESVQWFNSHPSVTDGGIGYIGVSKGAELGLLTTLHCPQIKALVNINGIPFCSYCPIKHGDQIIPNAEFQLANCDWSEKGLVTRDCYVVEDDDYIQTWTTDVKVLSLVSENDQCVNPNCNHHFHSLVSDEKKKNYEIIEYPGAGHLLEPPYSPHCWASYHKILRDIFVWGGTPEDHNTAQVDAWRRILEFFRANLAHKQKPSSHL